MLRVDHASLRVARLALARERLEQRFGLVPTPTPAAPDTHSRLYLDRSYLEVSQGPGQGLEYYFFGFQDRRAVEAHLALQRLTFTHQAYVGADGTWDDLTVQPPPGVPVPMLVRRTEPEALAQDWPPPRPEAWACGARALVGFRLQVASLHSAAPFFQALLGGTPTTPRVEPRSGRTRVDLRWPGGTLTLVEGDAPRIEGVVLRVAQLEATAGFLQERGTLFHREEGELWAQDPQLPGLELGFSA